ncbi:MAG: hypothetical protein HY342_09140 [Candidatus Lambdaproteobacteria bacterium]|nr:hypothetical protein [Candidatus Lambdaproteobacteria bacterium]
MVSVMVGNERHEVSDAVGQNDALWLPQWAVEEVTGWRLKPQGFCRDDVCVPVPPGRQTEFVDGGRVNVAAFWRLLEAPALHDADGGLWVLGESAGRRAAQLESLEAPDFRLPDLAGRVHALSDLHGRKVLLVTWASW